MTSEHMNRRTNGRASRRHRCNKCIRMDLAGRSPVRFRAGPARCRQRSFPLPFARTINIAERSRIKRRLRGIIEASLRLSSTEDPISERDETFYQNRLNRSSRETSRGIHYKVISCTKARNLFLKETAIDKTVISEDLERFTGR